MEGKSGHRDKPLVVSFLWVVSCSAVPPQVYLFGEADRLLVILQNRRVDSGNDPVVWHSFGVTHIVRTEDFPVMPVEHVRLDTLLFANGNQLRLVACNFEKVTATSYTISAL